MPEHTDTCWCSIHTYRVMSSTSYALSMTCLTADTTTESNRRERPDFLVSRSNATRNSCHVYHDVMSYIVINCRTRGCANRSIGQHTREFKCTATVTATVSSITEEYRTNQFAEAGVKSKKSHSMIKQLFQIGEHHSGALLDSVWKRLKLVVFCISFVQRHVIMFLLYRLAFAWPFGRLPAKLLVATRVSFKSQVS